MKAVSNPAGRLYVGWFARIVSKLAPQVPIQYAQTDAVRYLVLGEGAHGTWRGLPDALTLSGSLPLRRQTSLLLARFPRRFRHFSANLSMVSLVRPYRLRWGDCTRDVPVNQLSDRYWRLLLGDFQMKVQDLAGRTQQL